MLTYNLQSHVPLHAKLRVPYSEVMAQLTTRPEFLELLNSIQRRDNIQVTLHNGAPVDEDIVLDITVNMATASCLSGVVEQIVDFLQAEDVPVYPGTVPPRTEPVRDAFQFFNSAILATGSNSLSPEGSTSPTVNQKILLSARSSPPLTRPPSRPPGLNVGPGSRARDIRQPVGTPNHSAAESFAAPSGYGNLSIGSDRAAVGPSRVPFVSSREFQTSNCILYLILICRLANSIVLLRAVDSKLLLLLVLCWRPILTCSRKGLKRQSSFNLLTT